MKELDDQTPVASIKTLMETIKAPLSADGVVSGLDRMITNNDRLEEPFNMTPELLSVMMLCKMPSDMRDFRNNILEKMTDETVITPHALLDRVKQHLSLVGFDDLSVSELQHSAFSTFQNRRTCFNCNEMATHHGAACPKPKSNCDYCGEAAGHMTKFCFVPNDRPLPYSWDKERKDAMMKKRAEFKARAASGHAANACFACEQDEMDLPNFWEMLEKEMK